MMRFRAVFGALALGLAMQLPAPAAATGGSGQWQWPLSPDPVVVAAFRAPAQQWGPGHRGVDLLGFVGQPVSAIGAGTVSFAAVIAGRGVVVVDHGGLRSTYEPVLAHVRRGESVAAGQVIGTLEALRSHCAPRACLHLGVRRGDEYLDPLTLLGPRAVRLKPLSGSAPVRRLWSGLADAGGSDASRQAASTGPRTTPTAAPPASIVLSAAAGATGAALATATAVRRRRRRRAVANGP